MIKLNHNEKGFPSQKIVKLQEAKINKDLIMGNIFIRFFFV